MSAIGDAFVTIRPDASKFAGETEGFFKANAAKFALVGAGIGVAIAGGLAAVNLGESIEGAFDTIRLGTGATGEALQALKADFKGVFASVPTDAASAGTAVADLNTRLGLTGEPLQAMATQFLNLSRITGTDLGANIADLTRVFGDWSVASEDQAGVMDAVFRASQVSGIGINQLSQKVVQFGAPLRQMGFGLDESIALLAKWEKEGVNGELVLGSLRIAMGKFARDNVPMREGLDDTVRTIQEMGPGAESTALAMEVFGARAGPDMAAAILEGRFAVDDYLAAISGGSETINQAAADVHGWQESLAVLKNQIVVGLAPALGAAVAALDAVTQAVATRLVPAFQAHVLPVLQAFAAFLTGVVTPAIQAHVMPLLQRFTDFAGEKFREFQRYYVESIKPALENIVRLVRWLVGEIRERWPEIERVIRPVLENVQNVVETVFGVVTGVLNAVIKLIGGDFSGAWNAMKDVARTAMSGVKESVENGIALIRGLLGLFFELGKDLVQGFVNGIKSMAGAVVGAVKDTITDRVTGFVKGAFGISSPSKVFSGIGEDLMAGLGVGLDRGFPRVAGWLEGMAARIPEIAAPTLGGNPAPSTADRSAPHVSVELVIDPAMTWLRDFIRVEVREENDWQQTSGARLAAGRA